MTTHGHDPAVLREHFYAQVAPAVRAAIERVISARNGDVFVVGGVVRDLLLDRAIVDVDLLCEDDAIERATSAFPGERITTHARFRTAGFPVNESWIDAATARRESYAEPGALPTVEPAGIDADLRRRDFSMNALALRLTDEAQLLDPCDGLADVGAGIVRVLHDDSFRDDATRLFRAFRYGARLGFTVEAHTAGLINRDVSYISSISGARLRRELELMLGEATGGEGLSMAEDAGALAAIDPGLAWATSKTAALAQRPQDVAQLPYAFAILSASASGDEAAAIAGRLHLRAEEAAAVRALASMRDTGTMLRRSEAKPSGVTVLLDRYPAAAVAAFAETTDDVIAARVARRYLREWRLVRPLLRGGDLIALGVPEGPQVHRGLQLIRAARLDGWAEDEGDERALALRFAKSIRDSSIMHADVELHVNGH